MIKINASMQFLLHLMMLEIMGGLAWIWSSNLELSKCEFELVRLIVMIFGINHGYMMLDKHFESIQIDKSVYLTCAERRVSWSCKSNVDFWIKYVYLA